MADRSDPIERATDGSRDLYDIATWEPRSLLDRLSSGVYGAVVRVGRGLVILAALVILIAQLVLSGLAAAANSTIGIFILLSVVPALAIAVYVWRADVTSREPLSLLVATFLLGVLFAGFAAILNSIAQPLFVGIPLVGMALFFYLIVAPVEETVKWLAIRLYAFRFPEFNAVIDGAVYGAVAGLGFATIENTIYIGQQYLTAIENGAAIGPIGVAFQTAAVRTFAGPGHVLYSAFAGYYLGLAKFNPDNAGPIAVKGILIAAFIHGTYNTLVTYLPGLLDVAGIAVSTGVAFLAFVVIYDGIVGYFLYRKISRYRRAYRDVDAAAVQPGAD